MTATRPAEEGQGRQHHPPMPDGHKLGDPGARLLLQNRDRVEPARSGGPLREPLRRVLVAQAATLSDPLLQGHPGGRYSGSGSGSGSETPVITLLTPTPRGYPGSLRLALQACLRSP